MTSEPTRSHPSAEPGQPETAPERQYSIGELSAEFDMTARAIRFYELRGLLSPTRVGTVRHYSRRDRARLSLIQRGKNLGFSLEDIAAYLTLYDADPAQIAQTRLLLGKIEAALADLFGKRRDLEAAICELETIRASCLDHLRTKSED